MKKKLRKVIIFILVMIIIYCIWQIGSYFYERLNSKQEFAYIQEMVKQFEKDPANDTAPKKIDYLGLIKELKKENNDTVGYLKVEGTEINYPLMQAKDNSFYLRRNFKKEKNLVGVPFIDFNNNPDLTDKNTVVYGHMINMVREDMFAPILNFKDPDYSDKSTKMISLITERGIYRYRIFSIIQVAEGADYRSPNPDNKKFISFLNELKDRSLCDMKFDRGFDESSRILTLSTCTPDHDSSKRIALFAVFESLEK